MVHATLKLTLDRTRGTFRVDADSTKLYSRDDTVSVEVRGFTADEATLKPYLQLFAHRRLVAQAELKKENTGLVFKGTLSTNTVELVSLFGSSIENCCRDLAGRIFSTTSNDPIAQGHVLVWNFIGDNGGALPSNIPSGAAALADLETRVEANETAIDLMDGSLTAVQAGVNANTAKINTNTASITAHTAAIANANTAIAAKADAATAALKSEVYTKQQTLDIVARAVKPLDGVKFILKDVKNAFDVISFITKALGGRIDAVTNPTSSNPTVSGIIPDGEGNLHSIRVVKDDSGEYTTVIDGD